MSFVKYVVDNGAHSFLIFILLGEETVAVFLVTYGPACFVDKVAIFPFSLLVNVFVGLCEGIIGFPIGCIVVVGCQVVRADNVKGRPKSFFDGSS